MKRRLLKIVVLSFFTITPFSMSYANEAPLANNTYTLSVTSDTENQPVSFMVSYLYSTTNGEMAHYQMTRSTPWEITVNASNLHALFSAITDNKKLHVAILEKSADGQQSTGSATARGISVSADKYFNITGMS